MKKQLLLLGLIVILATGCGNTNNSSCIINANGTCITKVQALSSKQSSWNDARKTCDGVKNMPNPEDLSNIASYIYEDFSISQESSRYTANKEHFNKFGSPIFYIWSSEKISNNSAYLRQYYMVSTEQVQAKSDANFPFVTAVCVKH